MDQPAAMRTEDALDPATVGAYLRTTMPGLMGNPIIRQFKGGASNLTYQLDFESGQSYILRTAPLGTKAKGAHDMGREYRIMAQLRPNYPKIPQMLAFCDQPEVLGRPFFVMEKMQGIILRANPPKGLHLPEKTVAALCQNAIGQLVALHRLDVDNTGLAQFGKGEGYVQRQLEGWTTRYTKAKTWNVPSFVKIMDWLNKHQPAQSQVCFIHNDFRFDNLVLHQDHPDQIVGVLDWEMATVGDPLMDLGNSLAYWVQPDDDLLFRKFRRQPTHLPGMMTRQQVVKYYCTQTGHDASAFTFYEVYGLFRLAAIVQQIYYRYHHGQTSNPAFRFFYVLSHYLDWRCKQLMRR